MCACGREKEAGSAASYTQRQQGLVKSKGRRETDGRKATCCASPPQLRGEHRGRVGISSDWLVRRFCWLGFGRVSLVEAGGTNNLCDEMKRGTRTSDMSKMSARGESGGVRQLIKYLSNK